MSKIGLTLKNALANGLDTPEKYLECIKFYKTYQIKTWYDFHVNFEIYEQVGNTLYDLCVYNNCIEKYEDYGEQLNDLEIYTCYCSLDWND